MLYQKFLKLKKLPLSRAPPIETHTQNLYLFRACLLENREGVTPPSLDSPDNNNVRCVRRRYPRVAPCITQDGDKGKRHVDVPECCALSEPPQLQQDVD